MQITLRDALDFLIYLGAVTGALAAIWIFLRVAIVRPIKQWIKNQVVTPVNRIHAEVTPNGGHSIKDDVTGIKSDIETVRTTLHKHMTDDHASIVGMIEEMRAEGR